MSNTEDLAFERPDGPKQRKQGFPVALMVGGIAWAVVPLLAIVLFSIQFAGAQVASIIGACLVLGGASAAVGAFSGFLFAIPKSLQDAPPEVPGKEDLPLSPLERLTFSSNSNLEQISDWLTKIIVGVGLVELKAVPTGIENLAASIRPALGDLPSSGAFGVGLLIYCFAIGFLQSYMWTRTRFFQVLVDYMQRVHPRQSPQ